MSSVLPSIEEVQAVARLVHGTLSETPLTLLCERTDTEAWGKQESHRVTGAIDVRGGNVDSRSTRTRWCSVHQTLCKRNRMHTNAGSLSSGPIVADRWIGVRDRHRNIGRYNDAVRLRETHAPNLPMDEQTIVRLLSAAGYATAIREKWHLGVEPKFAPHHHDLDHSSTSTPKCRHHS